MIELLIALILIGALLYLVSIVPIDGLVKRIIYVVAIVAVLIWLLRHAQVLGI